MTTTTSPAAIKAAYAKNCIQNIEVCNICNVHSADVRTRLQNIAVCNMTAKSAAPIPPTPTASKRDNDTKSSHDLVSELSAMMVAVIAAALSIERAINGITPNGAEYYVFYGMVLIALTSSLLTIKLAEK